MKTREVLEDECSRIRRELERLNKAFSYHNEQARECGDAAIKLYDKLRSIECAVESLRSIEGDSNQIGSSSGGEQENRKE